MKQRISPFRRLIVWLRRFRKRRGYGIHSPFAFNFVTQVVFQRTPYYAYDELKAKRNGDEPLRERDDQLLFRLANFAQAREGLLWDADQDMLTSLRYLQAGCRRTRWQVARTREEMEQQLNNTEKVGIVLLPIDAWEPLREDLLGKAVDGALFVLTDIHKKSDFKRIWQQTTGDTRVRVSFDLYRFGLLLFEKRLNKEDYTINYI